MECRSKGFLQSGLLNRGGIVEQASHLVDVIGAHHVLQGIDSKCLKVLAAGTQHRIYLLRRLGYLPGVHEIEQVQEKLAIVSDGEVFARGKLVGEKSANIILDISLEGFQGCKAFISVLSSKLAEKCRQGFLPSDLSGCGYGCLANLSSLIHG